MAEKIIITRGLSIPDACFLEDLNEAWTYTGFSGSALSWRSTTEGAGRELVVDVTGADPTTHRLVSDFTPYGVGAGPWLSSNDANIKIAYCIVAKASGMTGNVAELVQMGLTGYTGDGTKTIDYIETDALGLDTETDYTFLYDVGYHTRLNTETRQYKLRLEFTDSTNGGGYVHISSVGLAILAGGTEPEGYLEDDRLDSFYDSSVRFGSTTRLNWVRPIDRKRPFGFAEDGGAHRAFIELPFPGMDNDDRKVLKRAYYWNRAAPTDVVGATTFEPSNRGSSQPVLVAIRRTGPKQMFYAHMGIMQTSPDPRMGRWPDSGAWFTPGSIIFQERLD